MLLAQSVGSADAGCQRTAELCTNGGTVHETSRWTGAHTARTQISAEPTSAGGLFSIEISRNTKRAEASVFTLDFEISCSGQGAVRGGDMAARDARVREVGG